MKSLATLTIVIGILASGLANADDTPVADKPSDEHQLLKRFVGEWTSKSECFMGPDQPPAQNTGVLSAKMIGDFWVQSEMTASFAGEEFVAVHTIGYDEAKKKYVATWIDSVKNHLWVYDGTFDEATQTLTFNATGPSMTGGDDLVAYRDTFRFKSDGVIDIESSALIDNKWTRFVHGTSTRTAK